MSKELEALLDTVEDIKRQLIVREEELQELKLGKMSKQAKILHKQAIEEWFEPIKSALERNEKLEKAWEIVKEKEVNTADFRESLLSFDMTYKHYVNNYKNYSWELLTETEFNLLKEMLEEK